jgi:hypothetical protein
MSKTKLICLTGALLFAEPSLMTLGEAELIHEGKSDYSIVMSAAATEEERFAAEELRNYLEKSTGARLPIVDEVKQAENSCGIYVGWTEFALRSGVESAGLDREEWIIRTAGKNLLISGGRPTGTLYGVYEFLERKVGCHWFDRDTEAVPRKPDLTVYDTELKSKPHFWERSITIGPYMQKAPGYVSPEMMRKEVLFLVRNKSTDWAAKFGSFKLGSPGACHTFYKYSKDFPSGHPEYWSVNKKGTRAPAKDDKGPDQLCLIPS